MNTRSHCGQVENLLFFVRIVRRGYCKGFRVLIYRDVAFSRPMRSSAGGWESKNAEWRRSGVRVAALSRNNFTKAAANLPASACSAAKSSASLSWRRDHHDRTGVAKNAKTGTATMNKSSAISAEGIGTPSAL